MSRGCLIGRKIRNYIGEPIATATALTALPAKDPRHFDGCLVAKLDDSSIWMYDTASAAALGTDVLDSTNGPGQWVRAGGGSALGVGSVNIKAARYASAGALAAYARTGNVILANAVGALGAQDGVTGAAGDTFLLVDGAADADNGLYRIDDIGGATAYQMTRIGGADASAEVTAGMLVYVSEGTTHGNEWAFLTTDDAINLNTTGLVFAWIPALTDLASTAGAGLLGILDTATRITGTTLETATAELAGRVFIPVANDAALTAVTVAQRVDGMICVKLDDLELWKFDAGSAAGATDWCQVPDAGAGRWLRTDASLADLASVLTGLGGELVGIYDPTGVLAAATATAAVVENATNLNVHRPGVPDFNRLTCIGAEPIAATNTVTIGADVYEFNAATPPAGGTGGSIWVYVGVSSAASRANLIMAINGTISANEVTRTLQDAAAGTNTEFVLAAAGTTVGDINLWSAAAIGGAVAPSAAHLATTETLAVGTDIWDDVTMYGGVAQGHTACQMATITLSAAMIAKGDVEFHFDFTPTHCWLNNRNRAQDEAYAIVGDSVVLTLAGGADPNNQAADVVDVVAMG